MYNLLHNYEPKVSVDNQVKRALASRPDNLYAKHQQYDLRDLVSPYYVNPHQKQMLKDVIGKQNVDDIEMMNALVYSGIINASCPARGDPSATEKYTDPVTGRIQCRRPMPTQEYTANGVGPTSCPEDGGNPMANERYIDANGVAACRMPVMRGDFSCPPSEIRGQGNTAILGDRTRNVTLSDGTGICLPPDSASSVGLYPTNIVNNNMSADGVYGQMKTYVRVLDDIGSNVNVLMKFGKIARESMHVDDFKSQIVRDPGLSIMLPITQMVQSPEDLKILSTSLYEHLQENHGSFMKANGATYGGFMNGEMEKKMSGGRRTKKRSTKKRRTKKRSTKKH